MKQEIQQFQTDDGNIHRIVVQTEQDRLAMVSLETAHMVDPDHWIPRQHWFLSNGSISSMAGGHVIVHNNCAEYIYRPMTTEVEVKDRLTPPSNGNLMGDALEFKQVFSDEFRQRDNDMVNSLLNYFPIEAGMPDFDDVTEWLSDWLDKDRDSVRVQCWAERVLLHMSRIYPCNY